MKRSVLCEPHLEEYLRSLSQKRGICVGLLVGQPSLKGTCHIVHMNCLRPASAGAPEEVTDLLTIDDAEVAQHALVETRMLPGGFFVLGIFVIHPKNVFDDPKLKLKVKTILATVQLTLKDYPLLHGASTELDGGSMLVLHFSSSGNGYVSRTMSPCADVPSEGPCEWKFLEHPASWSRFSTFFETDDVYHLKKTSSSDQYDTEKNLNTCAQTLSGQLKSGRTFFNGEPKSGSDTIETALKDKKDTSFVVHHYLPSPSPVDEIKTFDGTLKFDGIVSSQVFVHPQLTFAEAELFVRQDIVRSLASRIQIHCDSLVQTDETVPDAVTLNELPRRIYFPVRPKTLTVAPVQFSDYIFQGEGKETALQQIRNILDVDLLPKDLNATLEVIAEVKEEERHDAKECDRDDDVKLNTTFLGGLAVFVLLVAILVYYWLK